MQYGGWNKFISSVFGGEVSGQQTALMGGQGAAGCCCAAVWQTLSGSLGGRLLASGTDDGCPY